MNEKVYICYVDFVKGSDWVDWTNLMLVLQSIGVDQCGMEQTEQ